MYLPVICTGPTGPAAASAGRMRARQETMNKFRSFIAVPPHRIRPLFSHRTARNSTPSPMTVPLVLRRLAAEDEFDSLFGVELRSLIEGNLVERDGALRTVVGHLTQAAIGRPVVGPAHEL